MTIPHTPMNETPPEHPTSIEGKLDLIITHLQHMDRRDRIRMWGGGIRSAIAIIPIILFLVSTWYFATHAAEIMKSITDAAAASAANYTKSQGQGILDSIKGYSIPKQ